MSELIEKAINDILIISPVQEENLEQMRVALFHILGAIHVDGQIEGIRKFKRMNHNKTGQSVGITH